MASDSAKKLLILYILQILRNYSDENHPLKQQDIIDKIESQYGMICERKSVGANIELLIDFGFDIIKVPKQGVYLGERELEPSEISFLVDAVFSSRSVDSKNAQRLSEKLSKFLSQNERRKYKYVYKSDQIVRTDNKQLFYTIDVLNEAIEKGVQVEFNYNRYYFDKDKFEKQSKKRYVINPYFLINNQGRYYLVCNYDYFNKIANYKVELISDIKVLDKPRKPITKLENCEKGIDIAKYANDNIYMFSNKAIKATLKVENDYSAEYIVEWFGKKVDFYQKNGETFVDVSANEDALVFWCLQYGGSVELVSPQETRDRIKEYVEKLRGKYEK